MLQNKPVTFDGCCRNNPSQIWMLQKKSVTFLQNKSVTFHGLHFFFQKCLILGRIRHKSGCCGKNPSQIWMLQKNPSQIWMLQKKSVTNLDVAEEIRHKSGCCRKNPSQIWMLQKKSVTFLQNKSVTFHGLHFFFQKCLILGRIRHFSWTAFVLPKVSDPR